MPLSERLPVCEARLDLPLNGRSIDPLALVTLPERLQFADESNALLLALPDRLRQGLGGPATASDNNLKEPAQLGFDAFKGRPYPGPALFAVSPHRPPHR